MDGPSALYHDSVSDMPMSATFPPPRHSSSSTSSQKVWFGSVQQISCEGSPGMALAFDRSLNKSRISSCESPYVSTSSRLSTGSNDGNDGNPGFMTGFNRSLRRDIDKHPTVNNRRPPSSRNLAVPNLPRRSISDSARHNVVHSTELSAAAGAITPAGPTNRIRPVPIFSIFTCIHYKNCILFLSSFIRFKSFDSFFFLNIIRLGKNLVLLIVWLVKYDLVNLGSTIGA